MLSRRALVTALGTAALAGHVQAQAPQFHLTHRTLGRTGRWVVPLGLGGQASLQWTGPGLDPAAIVVRAVELGVNYLDTANAYGPSQANYGQAFARLGVTPASAEYNPSLREHLFIATKTGQRLAIDRARPNAASAISELKRSLTVLFGDGNGWIPDGAYLDSIQIHNLTAQSQVDQIYEGLDEPFSLRNRERIGALAGLLDFRDGTNLTGLNPERRHWVRHIGITGHQSSPVLMNALQRDERQILDTLLVALNANDRKYSSHQHNVIPMARARGLGIIAMKAFADGVFYGKDARFSSRPADVILSVGRPGSVEPAELVRYPLGVPGVSVLITGIGAIDRIDPTRDQIAANLTAALMDPASERERRAIEDSVADLHGTGANYFQERRAFAQPTGVRTEAGSERIVVSWNTGYAGAEPIRAYNVFSGDRLVASLPYRPQMTLAPLSVVLRAEEAGDGPFRVSASEKEPETAGTPA